MRMRGLCLALCLLVSGCRVKSLHPQKVHREERGITFGRGTGRVEGPRGLNRPWRSRNLTAEKMFYEARGKDIGKGLEGVCLSPLGLL